MRKARMCTGTKPGFIAGILALLLTACAQQPIGNFERAQFIADGAQAHHDVRFVAGCTSLAQGEAERLAIFLRELNLSRDDDIVVTMGSTGSDRRDHERRANLRYAINPGPARVILRDTPGFSRRTARKNEALIQVIRHDQVRVDCRDGGYSDSDIAHRMPFPALNCANPSNLAQMAADKRDLTSPRQLGPARSEPAASAVQRQREGNVIFTPLAGTGG